MLYSGRRPPSKYDKSILAENVTSGPMPEKNFFNAFSSDTIRVVIVATNRSSIIDLLYKPQQGSLPRENHDLQSPLLDVLWEGVGKSPSKTLFVIYYEPTQTPGAKKL